MKKSPTELINIMLSGLMVLLTFAGALVFFFTHLLEDRAYGAKRYLLGTVFLAYCIYRSCRIYIAYGAQRKS